MGSGSGSDSGSDIGLVIGEIESSERDNVLTTLFLPSLPDGLSTVTRVKQIVKQFHSKK